MIAALTIHYNHTDRHTHNSKEKDRQNERVDAALNSLSNSFMMIYTL